MRLNKHQREGLAKICDSLATAFLLGAVFGFWVEEKLGLNVTVTLLILGIFSITLGVLMRFQRDSDAGI